MDFPKPAIDRPSYQRDQTKAVIPRRAISPDAGPSSRLAVVCLLFASVGTFAFAAFNIVTDGVVGVDWTKQVTVLTVMWVTSYIVASKTSYKTYYLLSTTYLILLILFHFGLTIPASFGFFQEHVWKNISSGAWKASYWNQKAAWYTLVALGCFGCGFAVALLTRKSAGGSVSHEIANHTLDFVYWMGLGLLIASAIMLAYAVASLGNLLQYSRFDLFRGVGGDVRGIGVFLMIYPAAVTLLVIGAGSRIKRWSALGLAVVSFLFLLLQGDRSIAMVPVLVGVVLWVKVGRRVPALLAIGAIAFVLIAIPAVAMLRQVTYDKLDQERIRDAVQDTTFMQSFAIMGQTGGVLGHVLRLVPEKYPYRYGSTYVEALEKIIPNVGLKESQGVRTQLRAKNLTNRSTVEELSPDAWLSYELLGRQAFLMGHGVGFSVVGEPYMNFGMPGVIGFFLIIGYLLCKLDGVNLLARPKTLIFSCTMFPAFVFMTRNEFSTFVKPAAFMLIIMLIWYWGTRMFRNRPRPAP